MKSIFLLLFSVCLISQAVAQQKAEMDTTAKYRNELFRKGRVSFGLKVGYTQSNLYGSDVELLSVNRTTSALNGFHAGLTANTMTGKFFWLKHDLTFQQNGSGIILNDSVNGDYNSSLKMFALHVMPVSPTFHFKGIQLYAGPYVSALLDASIERKDNLGNEIIDKTIYGNDRENTETNKYLQKYDFGFVAGIEYEFSFGLNIGVRYTKGFVPIFDNANVNTFQQDNPTIKIYNQVLNVSLGYSFIKRKEKK